MRGDAATMEVLRPRSAAEAVKAYAADPKALPVAGGTDVMVAWNMGQLNGRTVLDLSGVSEWRRIVKVKEGVSIGALATHAALQSHPLIWARFPLLVEACATIGAAQIQNRGTLGGNVANASPAGDTFPPLAVYEPLIHVVSPRGRRIIAFSEIFAGVKKTTLQPSELIGTLELHFLAPQPSRQYFRKVGTRAANAISKTVAAGLLWLAKDGKVAEMRFALGSVAPTVKRLRTAEEFLAKKRLTAEAIDEACRLVAADISPIDDIRSTREYRLQVSRNLLRHFLEGKA